MDSPPPALILALLALLAVRVTSSPAESPAISPPPLPNIAGSVTVPAQEWPLKPGPRTITIHVRYPGVEGRLTNVGPATGLMLSLHNWGGTAFAGTADPEFLARTFDVVAIGVDYLQSGRQAAIDDPEPYDFGWLQALDALRALHFVFAGLEQRGIDFDRTRIFATGGSGGGNVSLMANKLAPHTFTTVVDLCGMKKLSDDIAFGLPGGSELNARYTRDPTHRFHLSPDAREIRWVAHPQHLAEMRRLGNRARIVTVHGVDDATCPDLDEYATNMLRSGLDFVFLPVTRDLVDGRVFTGTGHALGDRTRIVEQVAGRWLDPKSPEALRRTGPTDFERRGVIRYSTRGGVWRIDYSRGFPVGRFDPNPQP